MKGRVIHVESITLSEYIRHQCDGDWSFVRIIDGYYFETYNDTVNKVIKGLYELRQKLKADENESGQEVIKMIMNASYGKCCLKPSTTNTEVVSSKQFDKYMGLHGSDVK